MSVTPTLIDRPLSIGEILDRAFRLYRAHFVPLTLITAVFNVPYAIIAATIAAVTASEYQAAPGTGMLGAVDRVFRVFGSTAAAANGWTTVLQIVAVIISIVVTLALVATCARLLHGETLPLGQSIRRGTSRFWGYGGMILLQGLSLGGIAAGGILLATVVGVPMLALIIVIPLLFLMTRWVGSLPSLIIGQKSPTGALGRSWELTSGFFWRCATFLILISLLGYVMVIGPAAGISVLTAAVLPPSAYRLVLAIDQLVTALVGIVWEPIAMASYVLFYYDLRVRKEGYDLELRMGKIEQIVAEESSEYPYSQRF